jgi:hypothetical protein
MLRIASSEECVLKSGAPAWFIWVKFRASSREAEMTVFGRISKMDNGYLQGALKVPPGVETSRRRDKDPIQ